MRLRPLRGQRISVKESRDRRPMKLAPGARAEWLCKWQPKPHRRPVGCRGSATKMNVKRLSSFPCQRKRYIYSWAKLNRCLSQSECGGKTHQFKCCPSTCKGGSTVSCTCCKAGLDFTEDCTLNGAAGTRLWYIFPFQRESMGKLSG